LLERNAFTADLGQLKMPTAVDHFRPRLCSFSSTYSYSSLPPQDIFKSAPEQLAEHEIGADNGQDAQQFLHKVQDIQSIVARLAYLNLFFLLRALLLLLFLYSLLLRVGCPSRDCLPLFDDGSYGSLSSTIICTFKC